MKKFLVTLVLVAALVIGISVPSFATQNVTFNWPSYTADTVTGFYLYMYPVSGTVPVAANRVATITGQSSVTYTQPSVSAGQHYWVLTAYVTSGGVTVESDPTNEVGLLVKPAKPGTLTTTVTVTFDSRKVTVSTGK